MHSAEPLRALRRLLVPGSRLTENGLRRTDYGQRGYSLLELLLALVILVIALVPVMDSITTSYQSGQAAEEHTLLVNYARQKMDDVLAMSFDAVPISSPPGTPTALSDTVTVSGKTVNRNVLVELYDGDGDSLPDNDLKKITVVTADITQETLMADD